MRAKALPLWMKSVYALKLALVILISVPWIFVNVDRVQACSCGPIAPSEMLERGGTIFSGEAVAKHILYQDVRAPFSVWYLDQLADSMPDLHLAQIVYEFRIETIWNGPAYEYVYLRSHFPEACGAVFYPGEQYLVYSGDDIDDMWVGLCGSELLEFAQDDLDELGAGRSPDPGTRGPKPPIMSEWIPANEKVSKLALVLSMLLKERESKRPTPTPTPEPIPTAVPTVTPVPATPTPQPTPSPMSTPASLAPAVTSVSTPVYAPQPVAVSEDSDTLEWLIPAATGVAGILIGVLAHILLVRHRRGGT